MAKNLVWRDLSSEQLEQIRHPHPKKGLSPRDLLASFQGITNQTQPKAAIVLDLYVHTLRFGESLGFQDDKLSGLFSIVKEVHTQSTQQRLQVDRSFQLFKELLLLHSVQRPPYSIGLFTFTEMKSIIAWMLDSYYRHYKLYMYAFTDRVLMNVSQVHPLDSVEVPPSLPPLSDAISEEQHLERMHEEQSKIDAEAAEAAAAEAEAAEAARLAALREAYIAAVPDEVQERVAAAVQREMERLRISMEEQFQEQQSMLQARIDELETKAAATTAAAVPTLSAQPSGSKGK